MPNIVLYGFMGLRDDFGRRASDVGWSVIADAVDRSVAEHNRQMDAFLSLFARRTTDFQVRFRTPTSARLMGLDENGRARPIRAAGHYDLAFPLQFAGVAWGANFVERAKMSVEEANIATQTLISADVRWVRDHLLAALFADTPWVFLDDQYGLLTVQGLANGDAVTYLLMDGADAPAPDDHYFAQANPIADGADNPFPRIHEELMEHPENAGEVVVLIPSNLKTSVQGLSDFREQVDPNLTPGANQTILTGELGVSVPGRVIGYVNECWIVEWRSLPAGYMIATTTDGERPLAMREDAEPELRGFRMADERNDYPFYERQWIRRCGFGAWNRVGALVYHVGNAAYAVPTNYECPMP